MPNLPTLRFASGAPDAPHSCVWRVAAHPKKGDVFLSYSKQSRVKYSLHKSGIWRHAAEEGAGLSFSKGGNRLITKYFRPGEELAGVTRGPQIVVPATSAGSRTLFEGDSSPDVHWFPRSEAGVTRTFTLYYVGTQFDGSVDWLGGTVFGRLPLPDGASLYLVSGTRSDLPPLLFENCERFMLEQAIEVPGPEFFAGGSVHWSLESEDQYRSPVIIDLPQLAYWKLPNGEKSALTAKGWPSFGRALKVRTDITRL